MLWMKAALAITPTPQNACCKIKRLYSVDRAAFNYSSAI